MKQLTLRQYSSCLVSSRVTRAVHTCILSMESLFGPDRSGYHRMTIAVASVAYLAVRRFARRAVCSVAACAFVVSAVVDGVADAAAHPGGSAAAEWTEDELLALSPMQLAEISVVSASLTPQRLADSPASVSVITAKQIARMGARTLYDVLRHVPGMRVDVTNRGRPVISVRGVRRDSSNQLLFLLDGTIDGTETTFRVEAEQGGFVGSQVNLLYGRAFEPDRTLSVNLNLVDQDGPRIPVAADIAGRSGLADRDFEQLDLQVRGELGPFGLQARYTHQDRGESHGALFQLSPDDQSRFRGGFVELDADFDAGEHTRLLVRGYVDYVEGEAKIFDLPRGTIAPDSPFFPFNDIGLGGQVGLNTSRVGLELQASDSRFANHAMTYGLLWEYQAQDDLMS